MKTLAEQVRYFLATIPVTQKELSKASGVDESTISKMRRGYVNDLRGDRAKGLVAAMKTISAQYMARGEERETHQRGKKQARSNVYRYPKRQRRGKHGD